MKDSYEKWLESNEDNLWAEFHETGANLEGADYEDWCENKYEEGR